MKSPRQQTAAWMATVLFIGLLAPATAQKQETVQAKPLHFKDTVWYDKGFDFFLGGGLFGANKYNAGYYSGSSRNECNLDYIFGNRYRYDDICKEVVNKYPYISADDSVYYQERDLPEQMRYRAGLAVTMGVRYKLSGGWALALSYNFTRLVVRDKFLLSYRGMVPGNEQKQPEMFLTAREDRSVFDLSLSYLFHTRTIVRPFAEAGVQFNFVDVKDFKAGVGGKEWTLLDPYGGADYVPGIQMVEQDVHYGGPGFGFSAAAGVKFVFNKYVSLDPAFYITASKIGLPGYKDFAMSYGMMFRVVMTDFFVSSR